MWVIFGIVTVTFETVPVCPETVMVDGYGFDGAPVVVPVPVAGMVITPVLAKGVGAQIVVKLKTLEYDPLPQAFVALTRQKCCVLGVRATLDVHVVVVRFVADATILANAASVATSIL